MLSSGTTFRADPLDHQFGPAAPSAAERRGLALALIAAAALHVIVPLALLAYYALWPVKPVPIVKEIPIQVVIEPPPQPKKAEPKPKPPKPPPDLDDEKPAYDAPRAATQEKVNRNTKDDQTRAPAAKVEPPLNPGAPPKSEAEAAPAQAQQARTAAPAPDLQPTPEADQPVAPAAAPSEADASSAAEKTAPNAAARPAPPPPAETPVGAPLPTIDELPQYQFARASKESPVVGGNAESRYLTIVYGMIKAHLHDPQGPHAGVAGKHGEVAFLVDEAGNLVEHKLLNSSGSPDLDMAVINAITEAAPYPAPPHWRPASMTFNYGRR